MSDEPTNRDILTTVMSSLERIESTIRAEIGTVHAKVDTIQADMGTMQSEMGTIRAEMVTKAEMMRTRGDIMARIDRLSDEVTGFRQDLAGTYAANSDLTQAIQSSRAAEGYLRQRIDLMQQPLLTLRGRLDDFLRDH